MKELKNNILASDLSTSPTARANRLKTVRNLANLSRQGLCEGTDLNENTVKGWEFAIHGGLTAKGAKKLIPRLKKLGIICELDWLLSGKGNPPIQIRYDASLEQEEEIATELAVFIQHYPNSLNLIIKDDAMLPHYQSGDCVAGPVYEAEKMAQLDQEACIVRLEDEQLYLRIVRQSNQAGLFNLFCFNPTATVDPVIPHVKILQAAPVIWHRRKII